MIFSSIDKWMFDIESKENPTKREKRQHMKLEVIRDRAYSMYLKDFRKNREKKETAVPKECVERSLTRYKMG